MAAPRTATKADYQPVFNAVARMTGLSFDLKVAQSYGAGGRGHVQPHSPTSPSSARSPYARPTTAAAPRCWPWRVEKGASRSTTRASSPRPGRAHRSLGKDLKGKRIAFGDLNSTSSFVSQVAMHDRGRPPGPGKDSGGAIRLTGSHAQQPGRPDPEPGRRRPLSFDSSDKAVAPGRGRSEDHPRRRPLKADPLSALAAGDQAARAP